MKHYKFLIIALVFMTLNMTHAGTKRAWVNFESIYDVYQANDNWSAVRPLTGPNGFPGGSEIVLDDFILSERTRLDYFLFHVVLSGLSIIHGIDVYIWDSNGTVNINGQFNNGNQVVSFPPNMFPLYSKISLPVNQKRTQVNTTFANLPIVRIGANLNSSNPIILDPGHYWIGYRVVATYITGRPGVLFTHPSTPRGLDSGYFSMYTPPSGYTHETSWRALGQFSGFPPGKTLSGHQVSESAFGLIGTVVP